MRSGRHRHGLIASECEYVEKLSGFAVNKVSEFKKLDGLHIATKSTA